MTSINFTPINTNGTTPPGFFTKINASDNPNNDQDILNFQNNINSWTTTPILSLANWGKYSYSDFTTSSITNSQITVNQICLAILTNQISVPYTSASKVNYSQAYNFYSKYVYNTLLNSTFYQFPWYEILEDPNLQVNATCNYAVRLNFFEWDPNVASPVMSIIDCITGIEKFRILNNPGGQSSSDSATSAYLRNIKRVTNGVVDGSTILTFGEMMKINTCINTAILDFAPWTAFQNAKLNQNPNDTNFESDAVNAFQDAVAKTPFVDGSNGNIWLSQIRLFAVNKPDGQNNYLLGIPFLPFNNGQYLMFDNQLGDYVGYSPLTYQNLTTVLKIVFGGLILYEGYKIARKKY